MLNDRMVKQIKEDISRLVNDMSELRHEIRDKGAARVEQWRDEAGAKIGEVKEQAVSKAKQADHYVHEKPWTAVGVAAALGAVLGALMTWRSKARW